MTKSRPLSLGKWRHWVSLLAANPQALPARDEDLELGAGDKKVRELCARIYDLLEVVEEAEHLLVVDVLAAQVPRGP